MQIQNLTCIGCPLGCSLQVTLAGSEPQVTGNTCKRGADYGKKEVTAPERSVTSTVRLLGGSVPVIPVRTQRDIPKDAVFACMAAIKAASVRAPVRIGDVVIDNVAGTGVNVIATKNENESTQDTQNKKEVFL